MTPPERQGLQRSRVAGQYVMNVEPRRSSQARAAAEEQHARERGDQPVNSV